MVKLMEEPGMETITVEDPAAWLTQLHIQEWRVDIPEAGQPLMTKETVAMLPIVY
ncbi:MAG TPA: hypothetical protein PLN21_20880 [Gemmatales bacterium]|nr:hypothetical protein [Gemmatales bacterium]